MRLKNLLQVKILLDQTQLHYSLKILQLLMRIQMSLILELILLLQIKQMGNVI